ncbi:MAG: hypothetical protein GQ531_08255 [Sulfurovum sp.]|nr:hypothetical protein [Sulfurovum sp.]
MRLGLYTFAALALIAIVGAVVYVENPNNYALEFMGINLSFPIAAWFVLPMLLLFFFTVLHMLYYGVKNYFLLKRWRKDTETLEDTLYWSVVQEPKEQKFAVKDVEKVAKLLEKTTLTVNEKVEGLSPRLSNIVTEIENIKAGEYIDLKEKKLSKVFKEGNPLLIQNQINQLSVDDKFVETVLRGNTEYTALVIQKALSIFSEKSDFTKALKYTKVYDTQAFLQLLKRVSEEDKLGLTPDVLLSFIEELDFSCEVYIEIASCTKKYLTPDENLALFKRCQEEDKKAQSAYLYLLFEYELLDDAEKQLDEYELDEFMNFRALYTLKKEHNGYRLSDVFDKASLCKKHNV